MPIDLGLQIADAAPASDWVRQSRVKEREVTLTKHQEAKRQAELQIQRQYEEEEELLLQQSLAKGKNQKQAYSAADLKGLKIMHDHTQFEVGQDVVLTLADTNILETDEYGKIVGLQEADDALENVNLADADRKAEREKTIKRNRQPIYSALDDYEFQEGVEPGTKAPLLPQYEKEKKSTAKMELGENGTIELPRYKQAEKLRGGKADVQSLTVEKRDVSDYYTKKEFSKFSKLRGTDKKKKRKLRKRDDDEDDEEGDESGNADEAAAATGGSALDDMMVIEDGDDAAGASEEQKSADRGSRQTEGSALSRTLQEIAAEEAIRRQHFDAAVARSQQKDTTSTDQGAARQVVSAAPRAASKPAQKKRAAAAKVDFKSIDFDEDDADMVQALARARKLALLSRQKDSDADGGDPDTEDRAAQIASLLSKKGGAMEMDNSVAESKADDPIGDDNDDVDVDGRLKSGALVFNSTTEFSNRLQARLNEKARSKAEAILKDATKAALVEVEGDASNVMGEVMQVDDGDDEEEEESNQGLKRKREDDQLLESMDWKPEGEDGEGDGDEDDEEDELDDEQLAFLHKQPSFSGGMAATLQLLKGSGELKKTADLSGRAKDSRDYDPSADDFGVKLEYRDEYGRKLTQKEAFRQLSYRFHGYGPGKKKLEKRLKAMEVQTKATSSRAGILDGAGGTMKSLTAAQAAIGKAHITIQGGANNMANSAAMTANLVASLSKSGSRAGKATKKKDK